MAEKQSLAWCRRMGAEYARSGKSYFGFFQTLAGDPQKSAFLKAMANELCVMKREKNAKKGAD